MNAREVGVIFPILINTMAGVMEIENVYFDVAHNFRADRV